MTTVFSIDKPIDIERVATCDRRFEYEPSMYPGLIFRKKEPRIGFTIFSSGRVVSTGGKNVEDVQIAINEMIEGLQKAGVAIENMPTPKICNLVAVTDFGCKIDIETLSSRMANAIYEPEQFPAIIFRADQGKLVVLIFSSGKAILTGARTSGSLEKAYDIVKRTMDEAGVSLR